MRNILYIGNQLSRHGLSVTSIETLGGLLYAEGYQMHYASSKLNKIARFLDMIITTVRLRNKVDYILIDTYSTSNFWYAFAISQIARFFTIPYIPILRGGDLPRRLEHSPVWCNMIFKNAYQNIAPSKYLFTAFTTKGYENIILLPNTIELKHYTFKERNVFEPKLLWVRALQDIYNPKMAIDVLHLIQKKMPEATLCMVGGEKNISINQMKLYAEEKGVTVTFTGRLPKTEWIALAKEYDFFINTTNFDNTPVSVMEAMALGLPVVSTDVGGVPALIQHQENGILVSPKDAEAMAQEILSLMENPSRAILLAQSARSLSQTFDWEIVKKNWFQLLK